MPRLAITRLNRARMLPDFGRITDRSGAGKGYPVTQIAAQMVDDYVLSFGFFRDPAEQGTSGGRPATAWSP
jgi:hypothetical protein